MHEAASQPLAASIMRLIMIRIPLSSISSAETFAAALEAHRADVEAHMMGKPGRPAPIVDQLVMDLVRRVPDGGPVADRGPDRIVIAEYEIFDDTPPAPETQQALAVLRETISG